MSVSHLTHRNTYLLLFYRWRNRLARLPCPSSHSSSRIWDNQSGSIFFYPYCFPKEEFSLSPPLCVCVSFGGRAMLLLPLQVHSGHHQYLWWTSVGGQLSLVTLCWFRCTYPNQIQKKIKIKTKIIQVYVPACHYVKGCYLSKWSLSVGKAVLGKAELPYKLPVERGLKNSSHTAPTLCFWDWGKGVAH